MRYDKLIEWLAEQEHIQWEQWSKSVSEDLQMTLSTLEENHCEDTQAYRALKHRLDRWNELWKPYDELSEEEKEKDRIWAEKLIGILPFKCPIHQCGGIMITDERPPPPDFIESERYDGDEQTPDLICSNCGGSYQFKGFSHPLDHCDKCGLFMCKCRCGS